MCSVHHWEDTKGLKAHWEVSAMTVMVELKHTLLYII